MTDERRGARNRLGPFHLGPSHDELGPGLGCLYEAWEASTGAPVLLLKPDTRVDWQPEGPWRIQLAFDPAWAAISVKVEESPAPPDVSDLNNLLVLTTAGVTRVEDRPQVGIHLATPVGGRTQPPAQRPDEGFAFRRRLALASITALVLGFGVWLRLILSETVTPTGPEVADVIRPLDRAPSKIDITVSAAVEGPYPLPEKPFQDQSRPPCNVKRGEIMINNGCWMELAQRPPCLDAQADYKGKCYLPVARQERVPQSAQP